MKTVALGIIHLDELMARQSDAINFSLASNSGRWESINSIKVDYPILLDNNKIHCPIFKVNFDVDVV